MTVELIIRSILLGAGLAMDAFSVSIADGLAEPDMKRNKRLLIAGTFAAFQFAMPMIGWLLVREAVSVFGMLEGFIPWIALVLLLYIGGKMFLEGLKGCRASDAGGADSVPAALTGGALFMQGVATSIDALSAGLTMREYGTAEALASSFIIGAVTMTICLAGLHGGRRIGEKLKGRASILGGVILIAIGLEIWLKGIL